MVSLANMKSQLAELETQKNKLEAEIQKANQRLRMALWGIAIGALFFRLSLWLSISIMLIAGIVAIFYFSKQTSFHDKLESLETEIHRLEISMV
jgi:hypothetical protein